MRVSADQKAIEKVLKKLKNILSEENVSVEHKKIIEENRSVIN